MGYRRTYWKDHVVQYPNRFTETANGDGTVEHVKSPGTTLQEGTPQDAVNFNKIEDGVGDVAVSLDVLIAYVMMKIGRSNYTLDGLDAAKLDLLATAAAATKLATPRTIGITGKATGAGVNFDGSANISISVTALDPTGMSAAVPVNKGGTGATDAANALINLGAAAARELFGLVVALDVATSIRQAEARAQETRLTSLEAQVAALT